MILEAHAKASIPILESCAEAGLHVIAGSHKRYCCGFYSRATKERVLYPCCEREPETCVAFLIDFLKRRSVSALFPVGDVMTDLVASHQDEFRKYTRLVLPPYEVFVQGRNKILTLKAAVRAGCPIPRTWYPQEQPIEEIAKQAGFPVLIKPAIGAGARGLTFCHSGQELLEKFPDVRANFGESFVQEFVPQTVAQYKVDAVLDQSQNLLAGVVYSKLRYYPVDGGSSVLNRTEYRPDILDLAIGVLREMKWVGFCDFDFITDPRDNVVKLMEINPRYPESYGATIAAGVDMTRIMYQLAKGKKPAAKLQYQENRYLRFLFGDIMWFLTTKCNRWNAKPSFFSFSRSDTIYQLLRPRDWGPIIGYLLENVGLLWDKSARRFKFRT